MVYPNTYLRTFWNPALRHEIFVAMSFAPEFQRRYDRVIAPAIRSVSLGGTALEPKRVDLSKSGDSIITEIMDGIAHCQLVLADVTSTMVGLFGESSRNCNVMYELGIAMACRQPTEVLIVRSDNAPLLFDVTTIPHKKINFDHPNAVKVLSDAIVERLNERKLTYDARCQIIFGKLTSQDKEYIRYNFRISNNSPAIAFAPAELGLIPFLVIQRLLDNGIIRHAGDFDGGIGGYTWTAIGWAIAQQIANEKPVLGKPKRIDAHGQPMTEKQDRMPPAAVPVTDTLPAPQVALPPDAPSPEQTIFRPHATGQ